MNGTNTLDTPQISPGEELETELNAETLLFHGLVDEDLIARATGARPMVVSLEEPGHIFSALVYVLEPSVSGSALQLVHATDVIVGQHVDFVG